MDRRETQMHAPMQAIARKIHISGVGPSVAGLPRAAASCAGTIALEADRCAVVEVSMMEAASKRIRWAIAVSCVHPRMMRSVFQNFGGVHGAGCTRFVARV